MKIKTRLDILTDIEQTLNCILPVDIHLLDERFNDEWVKKESLINWLQNDQWKTKDDLLKILKGDNNNIKHINRKLDL